MWHVLLNMADESPTKYSRPKRLASVRRFLGSQVHAKQEIRKKLKKVSNILKKKETERTEDEISTLHQLPDIVKTAEKNAKRQLKQKERVLEIEDQPDVLDRKCQELAQMLLMAKNAIVYTGAGISTAASIPDYRGPNGVWTLLKKGQSLRAQDLVDAEPTYTHMCIAKLFKEGRVKHLVSQNCDGLHVRSGFPRHSLSEVHGNMFIEICKSCKPQKEYLRLFDVTERTSKGRHKTGRTCNKCGGSLHDSIVHFGEKGGLKSPYKWRQAAKAASKSDLIVCLGSSLKVLRCYPCLWRMNLRPECRPKLVIVNLQWTPKDERSSLKIHGRCDDVLRRVSNYLGLAVPQYCRETDPLFRLHTPVKKGEELIANKRLLQMTDTKPISNNVCKKKVFHRDKSVSVDQQVASNAGHHSGSSNAVHSFQFAPSVTAVHAQPMVMSATHSEGVLRTDRSHQESANGHILDPIRLKLEQMLKSRGVEREAGRVTANGKVRRTEGRLSSDDSSTQSVPVSPLPSIQNFLPRNAAEALPQTHSHPQLRALLNIIPSQSSGQPASQEHEIFRVDLSTNPISITSTHCVPKWAGPAASASATIGEAPVSFSAGVKSDVNTSSCASNSTYAKLVHRIRFEHSYAKNPFKSRSSGKAQNAVRNANTCSTDPSFLRHIHNSHHFSAQSVIPVCSQSSDLNKAQQNMSFILNDQEILTAVRQVMGDLPDSLDMQADGLHHLFHHHFRNSAGNTTQEKIVVNLNSDTGVYLQPAFQPCVSTMQSQQSGGLTVAEPSALHLVGGITENCVREEKDKEGDCVPENADLHLRRKVAVSVPGWFGKGLRVRRKRSM